MVVSLTNSQGREYGILRFVLVKNAPAYGAIDVRSVCLEFEHLSGDRVAQNCQSVEESCRIWTKDRVGTLVSGNS
jgi:hypothetical protein